MHKKTIAKARNKFMFFNKLTFKIGSEWHKNSKNITVAAEATKKPTEPIVSTKALKITAQNALIGEFSI